MTVGGEFAGDFIQRGFVNRVPRVTRQVRPHGADQRPAGPRPRHALGAPRLVHPPGVMLKVHARIAEKDALRGVAHEPGRSLVGHRPLAQDGLITAQIGAERPVETQEGARRKAALPEGMTVLKAVVIEGRATLVAAMGMERSPVETRPGRGQLGTRRERRHRGLVPAARSNVNRPRDSSLGGARGFGDKQEG